MRIGMWLTTFATLSSLIGAGATRAAIIYLADGSGYVVRFDTEMDAATPLGRVSTDGAQSPRFTGLAYDPATDSILIAENSERVVYAMDAATGAVSSLFSTPGVLLYGGAVLNGTLYGLNEDNDTAVAYSLDGVAQGLSGTRLAAHSHAMGVDPSAAQLYIIDLVESQIHRLNDDGTLGDVTVAISDPGFAMEDVDYFGGDFLVAAGAEVWLVDGATGAASMFLDRQQLIAMGLREAVGVAVRYEAAAVPEPNSLALALAGLGGLALLAHRPRRRRRTPA